ncbi:MAG: pseudouridine synthase [Desulfobulbaceae bacterium BRH_c16a]|nr:MAG: pseudouridine synthase [Desulfobulbaceae bacterium BRH_c16a]
MSSQQAGRPRTIKLLVGYDGTGYSGWQRQKHDSTIQGEIESRLAVMTTEEIVLHGAGRTDAGVHAEGMVAHFRTCSKVSCEAIVRGLNAMLPGAIRIYGAEEADPSFHSRFSASGKQYQYSVFTGRIHPPQLRLYTLHVTSPLNFHALHDCLKLLEGTHDFSSFENSGSRDKDDCYGRGAIRTIYEAAIHEKTRELFVFQFTGDGFLRNMIRNLVGTLLDAGRGKITPEGFAGILQAKDRTMAGPTAPAHGLQLNKVLY